jgi:hypothetical protein
MCERTEQNLLCVVLFATERFMLINYLRMLSWFRRANTKIKRTAIGHLEFLYILYFCEIFELSSISEQRKYM